MKLPSKICLSLLIFGFASYLSATPSVYQFLNDKTVLINQGSKNGVVEGTLLTTYRTMNSFQVETGLLKATTVQEDSTTAEIISEASDISKAFYRKHPGVMIGDSIKEVSLSIEPNIAITPEFSINYEDLFQNPNANPASLELSAKGIAKLAEIAEIFGDKKILQFLIEAHTDNSLGEEAAIRESIERAMIVKQILKSEFDFEESRLIAIGLGGIDPVSANYASDSQKLNRRVVFKAVANSI